MDTAAAGTVQRHAEPRGQPIGHMDDGVGVSRQGPERWPRQGQLTGCAPLRARAQLRWQLRVDRRPDARRTGRISRVSATLTHRKPSGSQASAGSLANTSIGSSADARYFPSKPNLCHLPNPLSTQRPSGAQARPSMLPNTGRLSVCRSSPPAPSSSKKPSDPGAMVQRDSPASFQARPRRSAGTVKLERTLPCPSRRNTWLPVW